MVHERTSAVHRYPRSFLTKPLAPNTAAPDHGNLFKLLSEDQNSSSGFRSQDLQSLTGFRVSDLRPQTPKPQLQGQTSCKQIQRSLAFVATLAEGNLSVPCFRCKRTLRSFGFEPSTLEDCCFASELRLRVPNLQLPARP